MAQSENSTVSIENDLELILRQEDELQFYVFSAETAWEVGNRLHEDALARGAAMTFEIQVAGRTLFYAQTGFAPADQMEWIRRKRNVVMRFARSSTRSGWTSSNKAKALRTNTVYRWPSMQPMAGASQLCFEALDASAA